MSAPTTTFRAVSDSPSDVSGVVTADKTLVLLVEPDIAFASTISDQLRTASFALHVVRNGDDACSALTEIRPDVIIIDVHLPGLFGPSLCPVLRQSCDAPIMFVKASRRKVSRKRIWESGADAYVANPSRSHEVRARARALARRSSLDTVGRGSGERLAFDGIVIDLLGRTASVNGEALPITRREFDVLEVLLRADGGLLSVEAIYFQAWGPQDRCDLESVAAHIASLRRKLAAAGRSELIENVRTRGFRLTRPAPRSFAAPSNQAILRSGPDSASTIHAKDADAPFMAATSQRPPSAQRQGKSTRDGSNPDGEGAPAAVDGQARRDAVHGALTTRRAAESSKHRKVLIVGADDVDTPILQGTLEAAGVRAVCTRSLTMVDQFHPDLVLLKITPPSAAIDLCRTLRSRSNVLTVILTAKTGEADAVVGLEVGADDYITTPCPSEEIIWRVQALLRRLGPRTSPEPPACHVAGNGDIGLDPGRHIVLVRKRAFPLSPKEFALLQLLMKNPGRVLSRRQLAQGVWGHEHDSNTLDVHISRLRSCLEDDLSRPPRRIVTIRGVGYKFVPGP